MCAGAESVVLVFHGALHPLRDGCLRLQICPFCGSGSIPLFFDNERPGLHQQPGALVFAGKLGGLDRNRMEKPPLLFQAAAVLMIASRPLRGATQQCDQHGHDTAISIHAPLAGRDNGRRRAVRPHRHFNPRAPCGARRLSAISLVSPSLFQSTRPLRGATQLKSLKGVRQDAAGAGAKGRHFNPRTPCGVRPTGATMTASDLSFQSTHPLRGATRKFRNVVKHIKKISIHAPLAGCDW